MTLDETVIWLLVASAALFIVSLAILLYCCVLLIDVRHKVKQFTWRPEFVRDGEPKRQQRLFK